jgi:hypothetical protein
MHARRFEFQTMTHPFDPELASDCLRRATADVEAWLAHLAQGRLAVLAPFAQMFVYQLNAQGRSADKAFAIEQLYRLYYQRAGGQGAPPSSASLRVVQSGDGVAASETPAARG